jgi:hypothetical protein
MKAQEVYIALTDKCNKLTSNSNNLIEPHVAVRAINEALYYWYDIRLKQAEKDLTVQREISKFIKTESLIETEINEIYNLYNLPTDFYHINQLRVLGTKDNCTQYLDAFFVANNNSQELYMNDGFTPDFEWQQTLATLKGSNLVIYKKDFSIKVELDYYKKFLVFDIGSGYKHLNGNLSQDVDLELDNSDAFEVINIAALIITGNLTDPQYQVHGNNIKQFD